MPSGPEHYQAAEELLAEITNDDGTVDFGEGGEAFGVAAQVHATLANAAATALAAALSIPFDLDARRWHAVAGTKETTPPVDVVEATIYEADGSEPKAAQDHSPALQDRYSARKLYAWPCINHEIGLRIDNGAAMFVDAEELQRFIEQRAAGEPDEQPF